jgi:hypothetical protein
MSSMSFAVKPVDGTSPRRRPGSKFAAYKLGPGLRRDDGPWGLDTTIPCRRSKAS